MSECEKRYPRHLVAKPQKQHTLFYWQPSAGLKRSGYKTVPLGKDEAAAIKQAEVINAKVDQWRGGLPVLAQNRHGTLPWLIETYKKSPGWHKLRASTKRVRQYEFARILRWSSERGDPPMRTFTKRDAEQYWSRVHEIEGFQRMAQTIISRCSMLWNYALDLDEEIVVKNPFRKLDLPALPPRDEVWTPGQVAAVIETALATPVRKQGGALRPGLYYASVARAVLIAANTAQRKGDILAMRPSQYDGRTIKLTQSKTGTTLQIPVTEQLKEALDDYLSGTRAGNVVALRQSGDREFCINEGTGEPWNDVHFCHVFRCIATAAGIPSNLQFRDLRRTATVQLAEAGCNEAEIASIGGWSPETVSAMMKIYRPLNLTMAQNALVKLERYRASGKLEG